MSRFFHIPIDELMDRISLYDLDKYYNLALHLFGLLDLAPYKKK